MRNASSDGYFIPTKYQTPPIEAPRHGARRCPQHRRLGPAVNQRLDLLEGRKKDASVDVKSRGPACVSKSATELGQRLPRVYAGVATVTDLTATSSSVDTIFSKDDTESAIGDSNHESLSFPATSAEDAGDGDREDATTEEDASVEDLPFDEDAFLDAQNEGGHLDAASVDSLPAVELAVGSNRDVVEVNPSPHDGFERMAPCRSTPSVMESSPTAFLSRDPSGRSRRVIGSSGELSSSRSWTQKWKTRVENNRSVVNLCRRISLLDQRKVDSENGLLGR